MFEQEHTDAIVTFYSTYPRYAEIERFRALRASVGTVRNIFYGDSITAAWPLHEFFPNHSLLNRGIGGDNVYGLRLRLADDVLPYAPTRVFMLIGINGIEEPEERLVAHILAVTDLLRQRQIEVGLSSILPLRAPDNWDRFQYQDRIVRVNAALRDAAARTDGCFFLDYHAAVRDESGQLSVECAAADGTHVTFEAYRRMAEVVRPHLVP
jgi:lysophospholipase L1-like esterase